MTRICATWVSEAVSAVILVDTCLLLDVLQDDTRWADLVAGATGTGTGDATRWHRDQLDYLRRAVGVV